MSNEFKMVPVELTEEMKRAARNAPLPMVLLDSISARQDLDFESKFKAAIAAAPHPPALSGELVSLIIRDLCETVPAFGTDAVHLRVSELEAILQAHLAPLQAEIEESSAVIDQLSRILAGIAVALKGEELPKHRHGYHDLVERVTVLKLENDLRAAESDQLKARCDELEGLLGDMQEHNSRFVSFSFAYFSDRIDAALSKPAGSEKV